jgi:hypothetical protein
MFMGLLNEEKDSVGKSLWGSFWFALILGVGGGLLVGEAGFIPASGSCSTGAGVFAVVVAGTVLGVIGFFVGRLVGAAVASLFLGCYLLLVVILLLLLPPSFDVLELSLPVILLDFPSRFLAGVAPPLGTELILLLLIGAAEIVEALWASDEGAFWGALGGGAIGGCVGVVGVSLGGATLALNGLICPPWPQVVTVWFLAWIGAYLGDHIGSSEFAIVDYIRTRIARGAQEIKRRELTQSESLPREVESNFREQDLTPRNS